MGLSVILKAYFHIDIPVLRTFFGLFFILLGAQILLGRGAGWRAPRAQDAPLAWGAERNVLFGKAVLDLATLPPDGAGERLTLNSVFSHTELRLDPKRPCELEVDAAFSGVTLPDGNVISFGHQVYRSQGWDASKPFMRVKASVVFGGLEVKG